jgi:cytochrome c
MTGHGAFAKKYLAVLIVFIGMMAGFDTKAQDQTDITEGAALVKGSDCFQCHRIPTKLIGPAYKDVAAKYKGADDAKVTELAGKVTKGGGGNWGTTPMRAHPMLAEADAKKMVLWILSLSDTSKAIPTTKTDSLAWYDWRRYIF